MEWPNTGDSDNPQDNLDEGAEPGFQQGTDEEQKGSPDTDDSGLAFPKVSLDELPDDLRTVVQGYVDQIESGYKRHWTSKTTELAKERQALLRERESLTQDSSTLRSLLTDPAVRNYLSEKMGGGRQAYEPSMDDEGSGPDLNAAYRAEIETLKQEIRAVKAGREWDSLLRVHPDALELREAIRDFYLENREANLPIEKVYKFVKAEAQARAQEKIRLKPPVEQPGPTPPGVDRTRDFRGKTFDQIVDGTLSQLGMDKRRFLKGGYEE